MHVSIAIRCFPRTRGGMGYSRKVGRQGRAGESAPMRRAGLGIAMIALAASVAHGEPPVVAAPERPIVDIEGNLVLVDEVYLAVIDLPENFEATEANAEEVAQQIQRFLRRAGYEIASVKAEVIAGRIRVTVDEGRLARIVVVGRDVVTSIAIRLTAELP